jgi:predicted RNA binding protein YcfA (HicA-like mRNA interferase family)
VLSIKLRPLSRKKVLEVLNKNSFIVDREGARHTILKKKVDNEILTTFIGRHSEITATEIHYIIKQTQKSREEFLSK